MSCKSLDVWHDHGMRHPGGYIFPLAGLLSVTRGCDDSHDTDNENFLGAALCGQFSRGDGRPGTVDEYVEDAQVHGHANAKLAWGCLDESANRLP